MRASAVGAAAERPAAVDEKFERTEAGVGRTAAVEADRECSMAEAGAEAEDKTPAAGAGAGIGTEVAQK